MSSARLRVILRILIFRNISAFHDKNREGRNSETEMQYRRANPVCGERLVHLTEVTAIWVLTGEHLTGEITAEELCLCTLPVEMVPVAVIAPTHQIFRAM
ncbi:TPA: hypothetical protein ACIYDW_005699 [Escherichia coli]